MAATKEALSDFTTNYSANYGFLIRHKHNSIIINNPIWFILNICCIRLVKVENPVFVQVEQVEQVAFFVEQM